MTKINLLSIEELLNQYKMIDAEWEPFFQYCINNDLI